MSAYERQTPSVLLDRQMSTVQERADEVILPYADSESDEEGHYSSAYKHFIDMKEMSEFTILNNYSSTGLYNAFREFLKDIARQEGYFHKIIYDATRGKGNDNVINLIYWFKLYAGAMLDEQPEMEYEYIIRDLNDLREYLAHSGEDDQPQGGREADPVLQSALVLIWRLILEIVEWWDELFSLSEFDRMSNSQRLSPPDCEVGFIWKLNPYGGEITTYEQGEEGPNVKFNPQADVDFFPSKGNIVKVYYSEDPDDYSDHRPIPAERVELL